MVFRIFLATAAALFSVAVSAQTVNAPPVRGDTRCNIQISAAPTAWMIHRFDPFGSEAAEGTFSATFANVGSGQCRFTPVFNLDRPPFGLAQGNGPRIPYALVNMTDSVDVTPRNLTTFRRSNLREIALASGETRTILFKFAAAPGNVPRSGTFSQDIVLEARSRDFQSFGGTRLTLGLEILPSARIGLAGAFSMTNGMAVVDLGELREGTARVPLNLRVRSTGRYELNVTSANSGLLRMGSSAWTIPYSLSIGRQTINLNGSSRLAGQEQRGIRSDNLPVRFHIGDVSNRMAGRYSDTISISVTAR